MSDGYQAIVADVFRTEPCTATSCRIHLPFLPYVLQKPFSHGKFEDCRGTAAIPPPETDVDKWLSPEYSIAIRAACSFFAPAVHEIFSNHITSAGPTHFLYSRAP